MAENPTRPRTWRQRLACLMGNHPALKPTSGGFGWPDAYNCTECGRLSHFIDPNTGLRYSSLYQFAEERGGL